LQSWEKRRESMRRTLTLLLLVLAMIVGGAAFAYAGNPNPNGGQPSQSCGSLTAPQTPGNAASARGSAFNPDGQAGKVYAGTQPWNSKNPQSVSQYDVACYHVSQH
jgi:hypothetical protein